MVPFRKMHGLGNDFVILDGRARDLRLTPARAAALADRRRGIGADEVILLEPAAGADAVMRIYNPDGTEVGACGNATRCVAALLGAETGHDTVTIRTLAGDLEAVAEPAGWWRINMGKALLDWRDVPLAREADTLRLPLALGPLVEPAACSMGNPHATFFVPDAAAIDLATLGPVLEHDAWFPERANIGVVQVLAPDRLLLRVWERGVGLTDACGSGACAALVNAHRRGLAGRVATVELPGGALRIEWREDGHVLMAGPQTTVFVGEVDLDGLPA